MSYPDSLTQTTFAQTPFPVNTNNPPSAPPSIFDSSAARIQFLEDQILIANATLEAKNARLEEELDDVYARLEKAEKELRQEKERSSLERERAKESARFDEAGKRDVEAGCRRAMAGMADKVGDLAEALDRMTQDRDAIKRLHQILQQDHKHSLQRLDQLADELERARSERQSLHNQVLAFSNRIKELVLQHGESLVGHTSTIERLDQEIEALREEKVQLGGRLKVESTIKDTLQGRLNASVLDLRATQELLRQAEDRVKEASTTAKQAATRAEEIYGQLESSAGQQVDALYSQIYHLSAEKRKNEDRVTAEKYISNTLRGDLDAKLKELDEAQALTDELGRELETVRKELGDVRTSQRGLQEVRDRLVSAVKEAAEREGHLEETVARLDQEKSDLGKRAKEGVAVSQMLRSSLDGTLIMLQQTRSERDGIRNELYAVKKELTTVQASHDQCRDAHDRLVANAKAATERQSTTDAKIAEFEKQTSVLQERLKAEVSVSQLLRNDLERAIAEQRLVWSVLEGTQNELARTMEEGENVAESEGRLKDQCVGLKRRAAEAEGQAGRLTKELEESRKEKVDVETQLRVQINEYKTLQEDHDRTLTQSDTVRAQLSSNAADVRSARLALVYSAQTDRDLRHKISTLEAASAWTQEQLVALRDDKAAHDHRTAGYITELQRLESELAEREALLRGMRTEVERLRGLMATMKKDLRKDTKRKELEATVKRLTQELQQAQVDNPVKEEDKPSTANSDLQHELGKVRATLARARDDVKSSEADTRALQKWLHREISRNEQMKTEAIARNTELEAVREERLELSVRVAAMELERAADV